ncbi:cell wall protein Gas1 [Schizosaccharomyces cryophilus OY26]|uniref:1,3-beta-glucanosyltransferase n=1 Tax=Schizosaccharomyces cryophilus (strain OY26 / ATCC MYA-4695 / CBS 11777 / NBRC 106824 / NRRL Y48691) TaxID=653667 RepID=S9VXY7_SCHCR|nr:cell wall protein Gas1 [Schizosaccharomyces cryophilus OY26]EPY52463.1 cell wall protein Gas1 [Schizosaccharomyces cryophilus OY26]
MKLALWSLVTAGLLCLANAVSPVHVDGRYFWNQNGTRFFIKGIAYQRDTDGSSKYIDPLTDKSACQRDVKYLKELSVNTIRVYSVNSSANHDDCMKVFDDNGIYVLSDLSSPDVSINAEDPSWSVDLFKHYTDVVDSLAPYNNVLGFIAGNEVVQNANNTNAAAFVKAAVRDVKKYIVNSGHRQIPVGYSTNDEEKTRVAMSHYFDCGDKEDIVDFYGINIYEWCGDSNFQESGYSERTQEFKNYTVPVFFSEFGCIEVRPRKFTEIKAMFSDEMTDVWSGGVAYEYFQAANKFGVVSVSGDSVSTLTDFSHLSSMYASVQPSSTQSSSMSLTSSGQSCAATQSAWKAATDLPPTPSEDVCECMDKSRECVVVDSVDSDDYGDLFSYVCSKINCDAINANGTYPGKYGSFSYCDAKQKLNYVLNAYHEQKGGCDFSGSATSTSAASATGACSSYLSAAGSSGTNVISVTPDQNAVSKGNGTDNMSSTYGGSSGKNSSNSSSGNEKSAASSSFNTNAIVALVSMIAGGIAVLCI